MGLPDALRDESTPAVAPQVPHRADECRWAIAAWDAWGDVRPDAVADAFPEDLLRDGDAEKWVGRARDVRAQAAEIRLKRSAAELLAAVALCTQDADPFGARSCAVLAAAILEERPASRPRAVLERPESQAAQLPGRAARLVLKLREARRPE
jgi:hypothetical protein